MLAGHRLRCPPGTAGEDHHGWLRDHVARRYPRRRTTRDTATRAAGAPDAARFALYTHCPAVVSQW